MTKRELIDKLRAHREELEQMGVASLAIFGSAVRDEVRESSDIDILVEFNHAVGVFHFFSLQHRLEEILGVSKVDLVERGAVHAAFRERIFSEAVNVT